MSTAWEWNAHITLNLIQLFKSDFLQKSCVLDVWILSIHNVNFKPKVFVRSQPVPQKFPTSTFINEADAPLQTEFINSKSKQTHSYLHIYYSEGAILFVRSDSINE